MKNRIYISGVWGILHVGHLNILQSAKGIGGELIVGVNTDELTASYKARPIIPFEERARIVGRLKCVDKVIPHIALDETDMLDKYGINIYVTDSKWGKHPRQVAMRKILEARGIQVIIFPYTEGISTSELKARLGGRS